MPLELSPSVITTWTPTLTGSGSMTVSGQVLAYAVCERYQNRIMLSVSYDTITTGGSAGSALIFTIPPGMTLLTTNGEIEGCGVASRILDGGNLISGGLGANDTTSVEVRRYDGANWGLGASRFFKAFFYARIV